MKIRSGIRTDFFVGGEKNSYIYTEKLTTMIKIELINCAQDPVVSRPEASAAQQIKERFEQEFSNYPTARGTLYILRSVSIFGYKIRDIDLILIGNFEGFHYNRKVLTKNYDEISGLHIDSFICNIELKDMDAVTDRGKKTLWKEGTAYIYKYKNSGEKNITDQAFDQMNEFRQYLKDNLSLNPEPFMCDLIWFRALSRRQLADVRGKEKDNALADAFDFKEFLEKLLLRMNVRKVNDEYRLDGFYGNDRQVKSLTDLLCTKREIGGLTRKKFELVSQGAINMDELAKGVGDRLTILSGRAGTGKTIQLLQLAFHLANPSNGKRCLLLTYNNALVCDIKRLIDFSSIPLDMDGRTVSIQTVDSFLIQLMVMFEIVGKRDLKPVSRDYKQRFEAALSRFYDSLLNTLDEEDIEALKDLAECRIDWDYVLIDEGQDWPDLHKKVLFKLYGPRRIVVADGVDQFMMTSSRQEWTDGLKKDLYAKRNEMKVNLRQKSSLVEFLNAFSSELNLGWSISRNIVSGGQVEVYAKYDSYLHKDLVEHCRISGCESYDILILVPPCMVETDQNGESHYKKAESYKRAGIKFFDGTNDANRHRYPDKDQARLFQYDSCRGLEAWVTVCYQLDELFKYKMATTDENEIRNRYQGFDIEQGIKKYVYTWILMPLTRPVDKLVITLKDPQSEIGVVLKNLSERFEFIKWNIE